MNCGFKPRLRVVVTRPQAQTHALSAAVEQAGWTPVVLPLTEIIYQSPQAGVARQLADVNYDAVIFTSTNAVRAFTMQFPDLGVTHQNCYTVGKVTEEAAREAGFRATCPDGVASAKTLTQQLVDSWRGSQKRILYLRGHSVAYDAGLVLAEAGHTVDELILYRTEFLPVDESLWQQAMDGEQCVITLFSTSAVNALYEGATGTLRKRLLEVPVVTVGQNTATAATNLGFTVAGAARTPTNESVVEAIADWLKHR